MFNEEAGARRCVEVVTNALRDFPRQTRLIVVNDGSADRTAMILEECRRSTDGLTIVTHEQNLGYGRALQNGGLAAAERGYDFVVFMDSDLTNDPRSIGAFIAKIEQGFDLVKASRYIPGGGVEGVPLWRYWISRVGNGIARLLYGLPVHDCTNGFRAVRTSLIRQMTLGERGFAAIMEELYLAKWLRARVGEVPYVLTARTETLRPSSFQYRPGLFYRYLKYPILAFFRIPPREKHVKRI
jgi:dolichol-phosphate mannosyltransferase